MIGDIIKKIQMIIRAYTKIERKDFYLKILSLVFTNFISMF